MSSEHRTGYELGLEAVANLALMRASQFRQAHGTFDPRVAVLNDLAESAMALIGARDMPADAEGLQEAKDLVADEAGASGTTLCPVCTGKLDWLRFDDRSQGWCRTEGCVSWLT